MKRFLCQDVISTKLGQVQGTVGGHTCKGREGVVHWEKVIYFTLFTKNTYIFY